MRITDRGITALKPKQERYEVWEDGRTGLGLRVSPAGRKSWLYMYRYAGKARRMTLGVYPKMSVAQANLAHAGAKEKLEAGIDPGIELLEFRRGERNAETVEDLANEYLNKWARPRKRSAAEDERILRKDVLPAWRTRKAKSVTRRDVITLLDGIVDRGAPIGANRTLAVIRRMFNFAIERDIIDATPCAKIKAPSEENQRDRVLAPEEIKTFWHELGKAKMTRQVQLALKLMLVTAQRREEVVSAPESEFDFKENVWEIPGSRTKSGRAHRIPLSALALEVIEEARELACGSQWLFPSRTTDNHITPAAVSHALRNNLENIKLKELTPHDLRRTAASHMTELGISRLVVSKILNHADPSVTAVYDRYQYGPEKRRALDAWSNRLRNILFDMPEQTEKIVKLQTSA